MEARDKGAGPSGALYVVATPLGNLDDITYRAIQILRSVDIIASEDTRRTRKLLAHFGIRTPLLCYHEHNERWAAESVAARIRGGESVALVSDAGTPLVSDPGYRIVELAAREDLPVVAVPGPSAVVAALSVSGLPPHPFYFEGFLPRRSAARRRRLKELAGLRATIVFYESPHRIARSLADMAEVLGERRAVVARELTKLHEELVRGRLSDLARAAADREWRGEIVVLVAGKAERQGASPGEA